MNGILVKLFNDTSEVLACTKESQRNCPLTKIYITDLQLYYGLPTVSRSMDTLYNVFFSLGTKFRDTTFNKLVSC